MQEQTESFSTHPQGERLSTHSEPAPHWPVDTPGGRFYAEFDPETPISREGQLVFFAQFLHTGQRWERFLKNCPLTYTGNRGSKVVNPKNGDGYRLPQVFRRTLHESWSANGLRLAAQQALRLRR